MRIVSFSSNCDRISDDMSRLQLLCLTILAVHTVTSIVQRTQSELATLRFTARQIEASCARDFRITRKLIILLHMPTKLSVMRAPDDNVMCFSRCMIERLGYYRPKEHQFDVERLVEVSTAIGMTEELTRYNADKCLRIAWSGEEDCESFWQIFKCFQGSV